MVFIKDVERKQIEKFENDILEKIYYSSAFALLKNELSKRNLSFKIKVQHTELDLKKYWSHLVIDVINDNGEAVYEIDEPNGCLMLCEPICFMRHGRIVGIELYEDKEFLEAVDLLVEQVKKIIV